MQLGLRLGVDLAVMQSLRQEVQSQKGSLTETTFRALQQWHRNQVDNQSQILRRVLIQELNFGEEQVASVCEYL